MALTSRAAEAVIEIRGEDKTASAVRSVEEGQRKIGEAAKAANAEAARAPSLYERAAARSKAWGEHIEGLGSKWAGLTVGLNAGFELAGKGAELVEKAIEAAFDAAKQQAVHQRFEQLFTDADQFGERLRAATGGQVQDDVYEQLASKMKTAGASAVQIETTLNLAAKAAQGTGKDFQEVAQAMSQSFVNASDDGFKLVGVNIGLEQSLRQYAAQTGRTSEQLSIQERQMLVLRQGIEGVNKAFAGVDIEHGPLAQLNRAKALYNEATDALKSFVMYAVIGIGTIFDAAWSVVSGKAGAALGDALADLHQRSLLAQSQRLAGPKTQITGMTEAEHAALQRQAQLAKEAADQEVLAAQRTKAAKEGMIMVSKLYYEQAEAGLDLMLKEGKTRSVNWNEYITQGKAMIAAEHEQRYAAMARYEQLGNAYHALGNVTEAEKAYTASLREQALASNDAMTVALQKVKDVRIEQRKALEEKIYLIQAAKDLGDKPLIKQYTQEATNQKRELEGKKAIDFNAPMQPLSRYQLQMRRTLLEWRAMTGLSKVENDFDQGALRIDDTIAKYREWEAETKLIEADMETFKANMAEYEKVRRSFGLERAEMSFGNANQALSQFGGEIGQQLAPGIAAFRELSKSVDAYGDSLAAAMMKSKSDELGRALNDQEKGAIKSEAAMEALKNSAPTAIAASGQFAAAFIKDTKARAALMAVFEVGAALASFATQDYTGGGLHLAAAAQYGLAAAFAPSGASAGAGASASSRVPNGAQLAPTSASQSSQQAGPVVIQMHFGGATIIGDDDRAARKLAGLVAKHVSPYSKGSASDTYSGAEYWSSW